MKGFVLGSFLVASFVAPLAASANTSVGQPAPPFSVADTSGKTHNLADYKGKHVVLEWVNPGCPFVRKHYEGNMQSTQKEAGAKGFVWLAVNSTAQGQTDYKSPGDMAAWMQSQKAAANATLMDSDGRMGKAYGAKTTPHMYIIDPKGTMVYAGGIDSIPTADPADIKTATNYVKQAVGELSAGKPVSNAATKPYGCSVKYGS